MVDFSSGKPFSKGPRAGIFIMIPNFVLLGQIVFKTGMKSKTKKEKKIVRDEEVYWFLSYCSVLLSSEWCGAVWCFEKTNVNNGGHTTKFGSQSITNGFCHFLLSYILFARSATEDHPARSQISLQSFHTKIQEHVQLFSLLPKTSLFKIRWKFKLLVSSLL